MEKNNLNFCENIDLKSNNLTLVGLGNFGSDFVQKERFALTRHNVGAMFLDFIVQKTKTTWQWKQQPFSHFARINFLNQVHSLNLVTFSGFINQTGEHLLTFLTKTKVLTKNIILCVDNMNLPLGKYKLSNQIPHNHHNGLNNIKEKLKTHKIKVLQIGIDRQLPVTDWVLSKFSDSQLNRLNQEIFPQLWQKITKLATNWSAITDPLSTFYQKGTLSSSAKPHLAVIGGQWGDEGKGKIVDYCASQFNYSVVARFAGGNNAGHTIHLGEKKYHFSILPVTVINPQKRSIIGRNCLLDLSYLVEELDNLTKHQKEVNLQISPDCHLIMPYHLLFDQLQEKNDRGNQPIGTTKRGIGPCLQDKVGRFGIQLKDLFNIEHFEQKLQPILKSKNQVLTSIYQQKPLSLSMIVENYQKWFMQIKKYITPVWSIGSQLTKGRILFEGAQGSLLDIHFGTYPFVTSSNTISWAIGNSFPLAFTKTKRLGVFKAYSSRVGTGPFPTELDANSSIANHLVTHGHEYGVVTKRKRRVGWFDAVLARYACQINHFDQLAITLLDVLTGCQEVKICTGYYQNDQLFDRLDNGFDWNQPFTCQYLTLSGWTESINHLTCYQDLPVNAQKYLQKISELVNVSIALISVGAKRAETIVVQPFS